MDDELKPIEIPLRAKYRQGVKGRFKGKYGGNSGTSKPKSDLPRGHREAAQAATRANQMSLVLVDGRRRVWRRTSSLNLDA